MHNSSAPCQGFTVIEVMVGRPRLIGMENVMRCHQEDSLGSRLSVTRLQTTGGFSVPAERDFYGSPIAGEWRGRGRGVAGSLGCWVVHSQRPPLLNLTSDLQVAFSLPSSQSVYSQFSLYLPFPV